MNEQLIELEGWKISCANPEEAQRISDSLYKYKEYLCDLQTDQPVILDVGAHIGLAILYFKRQYPKAKITAFEPNPQTFYFLQKNMAQNNIRDVQLVNAGDAKTEGQVDFYADADLEKPWAWGDSMGMTPYYNTDRYKTIRVDTVKLSSYINQPVDLIKMDIEGKEHEVLHEISDKLHLVKYMAVEFHGFVQNPQNSFLGILSLLIKNNFQVRMKMGRFLMPEYLTRAIFEVRQAWSQNYQFIFHAHK